MVVLQVLNSFLQLGMMELDCVQRPFPDPPTEDSCGDRVNMFVMNLRLVTEPKLSPLNVFATYPIILLSMSQTRWASGKYCVLW
jgi:hypothetical protein